MARSRRGRQRRKPPPEARGRPRGLTARLRNYLLAGIVLTAPIGITIYLAVVFVEFVDERMVALLPAEYNPVAYLPFDIPGLGVLALLVALLLIGFVATHLFGRTVLRLGEKIIERVPVVRSVYGALKQIFETVFADSSPSFREVVLVQYPRRGVWAVGFITGPTEGEARERIARESVNIFLPTTPNPTSGLLLFVPRDDVVHLDMSVEEGMKMVISAGIVIPPVEGDGEAARRSARRRGVTANETEPNQP